MNAQRLEIARRVRLARREAGLSQARLSYLSGVSPSCVSALERGARDVYLETILALCDALGVTVGDLVAGLPDVRDQSLQRLWRGAA
jgi:transcriptional regulator with XRE-family HTH domain